VRAGFGEPEPGLARSPRPTMGSPDMRLDLSLPINRIADFLSTATGFVTTAVVLLIGVAIGAVLQFNDTFMFAFNLLLSMLAIVISGIILVSTARSEAALQVKLDYLIEASKAPNRSVGIEHKPVKEIESERERVERLAVEELDDLIEREVEEEVTERLGKRRPEADKGTDRSTRRGHRLTGHPAR
jgi:low affinity Fe/Cu permease